MDTLELSDMVTASFGNGRNLVVEGKMFIMVTVEIISHTLLESILISLTNSPSPPAESLFSELYLSSDAHN